MNFHMSTDETQNRITLIPENLSEDHKISLKNIFEKMCKKMVEINDEIANDILVRSTPCKVSQMCMLCITTLYSYIYPISF